MNQSGGSSHNAVLSDLGWRSPLLQAELESSQNSGGLSLSNSGRELRAIIAPEDLPAGATQRSSGRSLASPFLLSAKSSNAGLY